MNDYLKPNYNLSPRESANIAGELPVRSLDEIKRRVADLVQEKKGAIVFVQDIWSSNSTVTIPSGVQLDIVGNNFKTDIRWVVQADAELSISSLTFTSALSGPGRIVLTECSLANPAFTGNLEKVTTSSCLFDSVITTGTIQSCEIEGIVGDSDANTEIGLIRDSRIDLVGGLVTSGAPVDSEIRLTGDWELAPIGGAGSNIFARNFTSVASPPSAVVADGDYGDITVSGTGSIWTIDPNVVTFDKIQDIPEDTLIGRDFAGTGDPQVISLNSTLSMTGFASLQRSALTGDVTAPAGSNTTTIANNAVTTVKIADNAVTNAKLRDSVALSVIGNATNATTDPADIVSGTDGFVLRQSGTTLGFGTIADLSITPGGIGTISLADDSVTNAKLRNSSALSVIGRSTFTVGDPADIVAGGSNDVLRRNGTTLGFGDVAQSAVTNLVIDLAARVVGPTPATSTDNAIVRWDGTTGRLIQNSSTRLDDNGQIIGFSNNSLPLYSFSADQTDGLGRDSLGDLYVANNGIRSLVVGQDTLVFQSTDTNGGFIQIKNTAKQNGFGWENWPNTYLTHSNAADFVQLKVASNNFTFNSNSMYAPGALSGSVPKYAFDQDNVTGIGQSSISNIAFIVNSNEVMGLSSTYLYAQTTSLKSAFGDGSASTPTYSYVLDTDTGQYRSGTNEVAMSLGGVQAQTFQQDVFLYGPATIGEPTFRRTSTAAGPPYSFVADADTGMYRAGANQLGFATGGNGYYVMTGIATTTSTTPVTAITMPTATGVSYGIQFTSACRHPTTNANGSYVWNVRVANVGGTVTATPLPINENPAVGTIQGPSVAVSGTNVQFRVAGTAGTTIRWFAKIEVLEIV